MQVVRYVDSSGWTWEVCELHGPPSQPRQPVRRGPTTPVPPPELADRPPPALPAALADDGDTLYFISRRGTRKLSGYPRIWSSLPRQQLEALCERAVAIGTEPY